MYPPAMLRGRFSSTPISSHCDWARRLIIRDQAAMLLIGADHHDGGINLVGEHHRVAGNDCRRGVEDDQVEAAAQVGEHAVDEAVVEARWKRGCRASRRA